MKKAFTRALILVLILALPLSAVASGAPEKVAPLSMTAQEWTRGFLDAAQAMGLPLEEQDFVYEQGAGTGQHSYTLTIAQTPDYVASLSVFSEDGTAISICALRLASAVLEPEEMARVVGLFASASRAMVMASDPHAVADDADAVGPAFYSDLPAALLRGVQVDSNYMLRGVHYSLWMGFEPESFFVDSSVLADGYIMDFVVRAGDDLVENSTDGAQYILPATEGFICDIAHVGGWTLTMGYTGADDRLEWGILGEPDFGGERVVLEGDDPVGIVPCGDAFVYFGDGSDSTGSWMIRKPGEEPNALPLTWRDSVFYGDAGGIWYATAADESKTDLNFIGLDGAGKRNMGSIQGGIAGVAGVLADASIVLIDFDENTVSAWKDDESTVLYASLDAQIHTAAATADSVWVIFGDHFGRVVDGALHDRQEGYAMLLGRSNHQLVFLVVERPGASEARVVLVNDVINAFAELGRVPYSHSSRVELQRDHVVVWEEGPRVLPISAEGVQWTLYEDTR